MSVNREGLMGTRDHFYIALNGFTTRIGPSDEREWAYHESLVASDYERCHPDETFDDLKERARFSKDDQGLLREWMLIAASRATERDKQQAAIPPKRAA